MLTKPPKIFLIKSDTLRFDNIMMITVGHTLNYNLFIIKSMGFAKCDQMIQGCVPSIWSIPRIAPVVRNMAKH